MKKIAPDIMIDRDNDAIAAMTIMWGLVKSLIPSEVISEVSSRLDDAGMPRIATRNVEPGMCFLLIISSTSLYSSFNLL